MSRISDELRDYGRRLVSNASPFNCTFGDIRAYQDELADRIDRELVELPKDAHGEYIHIGDVMEWCDSGETLTVEGIGSDVLFYIDGENAEWTAARNKRHHHAPTVEDVLREFADEMNQNLGMYTGEAIDADEWRDADAKTVEKFAAKLREEFDKMDVWHSKELSAAMAENEKLRELVRVFYHCTTSGKCDYCPINGGGTVKLMADTICDTLHDRMRELGVEVDGE